MKLKQEELKTDNAVINLFIHSFIHSISIAPLKVHFYSEALPTQHGYCAGVSRRSATGAYGSGVASYGALEHVPRSSFGNSVHSAFSSCCQLKNIENCQRKTCITFSSISPEAR